jgi:hypothetical protein
MGKYSYTEDQWNFIVENLFEIPLIRIAKKLKLNLYTFARSLKANGIALHREIQGHYTKDTAKILGVSEVSVNEARRNGYLKPDLYSDVYCNKPLFSAKTIRNFITTQSNYIMRKYACLQCGKQNIGDLYCSKHLPPEVGRLKPYSGSVVSIELDKVKTELGKALKQRRSELGLTPSDAAKITNYHLSNYHRLERGERGYTIDNINHCLKSLGCTVKLVIEKGPFNGKASN